MAERSTDQNYITIGFFSIASHKNAITSAHAKNTCTMETQVVHIKAT